MTPTVRTPFRAGACLAAAVVVLLAAGCGHEPAADTAAASPAPPSQTPGGPSSPTSEAFGQVPLPPGRPGTPPVPLPQAGKVNGQDAGAVSAAALTIMWTFDTTIDTSRHEASLRAAPFLDPGYLAALRESPPRSAPGAEWNSLRAHRAYTTVQLTPGYDDQPPDTATEARRRWGLTTTPVGRDGWKGSSSLVTVFATLTRPGPAAPWRLSGLNVTP
jgi:hypothetical protein